MSQDLAHIRTLSLSAVFALFFLLTHDLTQDLLVPEHFEVLESLVRTGLAVLLQEFLDKGAVLPLHLGDKVFLGLQLGLGQVEELQELDDHIADLLGLEDGAEETVLMRGFGWVGFMEDVEVVDALDEVQVGLDVLLVVHV